VLFPAFTDAHAHLGLVDPLALARGGIAAVDDLGWDPDVARTWPHTPGFPRVRYAGAFLAAPGGYPTGRAWAPAGAVEPVAGPEDTPRAVARQLAAGASFIKVTLNADAGPVLDDATLSAIVSAAHRAGVHVVAHAEGKGQVARAVAAGVDRLAHTPWSERLDDALIAAAAATQTWVSTLDIHGWGDPTPEQGMALGNLRRFHAAGGVVVYGTDLGNGPLPEGLNLRELHLLADAGLGVADLVRALSSAPGSHVRTLVAIDELPDDAHEFVDALQGATVVPAAEGTSS
jgi:imidazolonepropionase-like amidohydrolase